MALAASGARLCSAPGALAQGDNCGAAVVITGPGTYTANGPSSGGGQEGFCYFLTGGANADWYSYTPASNGTVTIESCGDPGSVDSRLSVGTGTCGALTCVISNDDACGATGYSSTVTFAATGGTTYLIQWDDRWDTNAFDWTLSFSAPPPPANGGPDCANAEPVVPGTYTALSPVGGGASNVCFGGATDATWYSYLATADGTINVSSCISGADTRLSRI